MEARGREGAVLLVVVLVGRVVDATRRRLRAEKAGIVRLVREPESHNWPTLPSPGYVPICRRYFVSLALSLSGVSARRCWLLQSTPRLAPQLLGGLGCSREQKEEPHPARRRKVREFRTFGVGSFSPRARQREEGSGDRSSSKGGGGVRGGGGGGLAERRRPCLSRAAHPVPRTHPARGRCRSVTFPTPSSTMAASLAAYGTDAPSPSLSSMLANSPRALSLSLSLSVVHDATTATMELEDPDEAVVDEIHLEVYRRGEKRRCARISLTPPSDVAHLLQAVSRDGRVRHHVAYCSLDDIKVFGPGRGAPDESADAELPLTYPRATLRGRSAGAGRWETSASCPYRMLLPPRTQRARSLALSLSLSLSLRYVQELTFWMALWVQARRNVRRETLGTVMPQRRLGLLDDRVASLARAPPSLIELHRPCGVVGAGVRAQNAKMS